MWLLVGLGNPGPSYAGHRHNVGFMAVDRIAERYGFSAWRKKFSAEISEGQIGSAPTRLLKPQTFMNHSGDSVVKAAQFFKLEPGQIVLLYDELDLPLGKVRVKQGGGNGGHNGVRDIDRHIGPDNWRLRIGIDHPGHKDRVTGYVLSDFAKAERALLGETLDAVAEHIGLLLENDAGRFMNKIALALGPTPDHKERNETGTDGI